MPGSWEVSDKSVLIAILNGRDTVPLKWAMALRNLHIPIRNDIYPLAGMPFDHARNVAARACLDGKYTWLFFIDDDVVVPHDAFVKLAGHGQPIVSGLYSRRSPPAGLPVMLRNTPQGPQHIVDYQPGAFVEADLVGAGCLLIHRDVLQSLIGPLAGRPFRWRLDVDTPEGEKLSEDYYFCRQAKNFGYKIFVDTSVVCPHVGLAEATHGKFEPYHI